MLIFKDVGGRGVGVTRKIPWNAKPDRTALLWGMRRTAWCFMADTRWQTGTGCCGLVYSTCGYDQRDTHNSIPKSNKSTCCRFARAFTNHTRDERLIGQSNLLNSSTEQGTNGPEPWFQ